jgi:hypothetical protein
MLMIFTELKNVMLSFDESFLYIFFISSIASYLYQQLIRL